MFLKVGRLSMNFFSSIPQQPPEIATKVLRTSVFRDVIFLKLSTETLSFILIENYSIFGADLVRAEMDRLLIDLHSFVMKVLR